MVKNKMGNMILLGFLWTGVFSIQVIVPQTVRSTAVFASVIIHCDYSTCANQQGVLVTWRFKSFCKDPVLEFYSTVTQHKMMREAQKAMAPWMHGQPIYAPISNHSSMGNPLMYSGSFSDGYPTKSNFAMAPIGPSPLSLQQQPPPIPQHHMPHHHHSNGSSVHRGSVDCTNALPGETWTWDGRVRLDAFPSSSAPATPGPPVPAPVSASVITLFPTIITVP